MKSLLIPLTIMLVGAAWLIYATRIKKRHYLYIAVAMIGLAVLYPLMAETLGSGGEMWHAAPFLGSILITIGWIVTSEINISNSKRQHTITLITQHAFDPKRAENREVIREHLPTYKTPLVAGMVDFDDEKHPLLKAIDLELNFYEFLAVGAHRDDLDERLLRESLHSQFCNFYFQNQDYIKHWQRKGNGATWSHMSKMYVRWSRELPPKAK